MSVRPHPTDPKKQIIDFYPNGRNGKRIVRVVECTELQAIQIENSLRRESKPTINGSPSIAAAMPDFMEYYLFKNTPGSATTATFQYKHLIRHIGSYQLRSINNAIVEYYKKQRILDGVKHSTVNKELALLSSLLKWGAEEDYCEPFKVKRFSANKARAPYPDVPTRREVLLIMRAVPRPARGIFASMYYAGLRIHEAVAITRGNVDLSRNILYVTGKGNKPAIIPISRKLRPYLRSRMHMNGYLWLNRKKQPYHDIRHLIANAKEATGITRKISPHKFRHAFGVQSVESGLHPRAIQLIMRHSSFTTTEIYTKISNGALQREIDKF